MDALGIEQAYLGGGSFGAAISLGCAYHYPDRVRALFPSNIAGGFICESYLAMKLFKIADLALSQGIKAAIEAFDTETSLPRSLRCEPNTTPNTVRLLKRWTRKNLPI